jgi:pyridinium-3,5-bisthiocarboxylic acid mononucleotide nickel chelatase
LTAWKRFPMMRTKPWLSATARDGPMRLAYLDCFSGISGDMFLGALVDAGVSPELLERTVQGLDLEARLEISRVTRGGIAATKVDVHAHGEKDLPREEYHSHRHPSHSDQHGHLRGHEGRQDHAPGQLHGRGLKEINEMIAKAAISAGAKRTATEIFGNLGAAEAKIHNLDMEKVHFHEVGAVDAMVDIVCAAVGVEALGVEKIVCSPLNVGGGTVQCTHGTFPVPAPATVELLRSAPVYSSGLQAELVTPTGAAIVRTLAQQFAPFPEMQIEKAGYGAGSRDFPGHANVVRLTVGEAQPAAGARSSQETIVVLESSLDDLNPQVFGYVMDRLLEDGALDAFGIPVQMKKSRPGTLLTVLCRREDEARLTQLIFAETTTLGVRRREEKRQVLARKWATVSTQWGNVRLKIASMNGTVTNCAPEYEDCRRIATARHVPLKRVMQEAVQGYLEGPK